MAPDFRYCRHQLGETTIILGRGLFRVTLSLCLILTLFNTVIEARTEPVEDSWGKVSADFLAYERSFLREPLVLASLSPSSALLSNSPAGQWKNWTGISIPNHPLIQRYIRFYEEKGRRTFGDALERSWHYVPVMGDILESQGVPAELVYVVLVESCFKKHASHKGAIGYWQLLAPTARSLGLRVDRWVDERKDPVKSTQAAAKYLRTNYEQFGSWPLALAAYNAGAGPVLSAKRRCGSGDRMGLGASQRLPGRIRTYVFKVLAAIEIVRNLEKHGFERPRYFPVYDFEPIWVRSPLRLEEVAKWVNVPLSKMEELNPALSQGRLPPGSGFTLHLPPGARDKFDVAYQDYLRD